MAGGKGTRLRSSTDKDVEKPMFEVGGIPMVERVTDALIDADDESEHEIEVTVAVSPYTPKTMDYVTSRSDVDVYRTRGDGYVEDLQSCVEEIGTPVLSVASDLALLQPHHILRVIEEHEDGESIAVCTPLELSKSMDIEPDTVIETGSQKLVPTGLNVVAEDSNSRYMVVEDRRLALNLNTLSDVRRAEDILGKTKEG